MVTVAPGTPASLASVTVPVMDPVMPCPNALGCSAKASRNSRFVKRAAEHQIDLFAGGLSLFTNCFGIFNKVFIASPFSALPVELERGVSLLAGQTFDR